MKRKLYITYICAYILYLVAAFAVTFLLTPDLLHRYLSVISDSAEYHMYLASQSVAIQNVCHILFAIIFLLSLFPLVVFHLRIYRPLSKIIMAAAGYADGSRNEAISYSLNDELGYLCASLNYLDDTVRNSGEAQRKFISNVSHDFRSPLTSIKGYVEAMLDGTIPPEMQERYLGIVLAETDRLNKLTEGLLTLNTFDDQGIFLELSSFDLIPVITECIALFEVNCSKKALKITTSFASGQVQVHADLGKIQQVLYNLIDNAIKFSENGSEIQVRVALRRQKVFVSVKDYGEGIDRENLPKIWERFYKTDPSRGKDKKGTGLGLAIVKEIIRAHNQNINVISTKGVGTEFIFTLDRA